MALAPLWGCGSNEPERDNNAASTTFSQSDSAGIRISVTDGNEALSRLGWAIDSVPELVLGAGSNPDEQFFRIAGVQGLPGGDILVVDGGSQSLRFFDSAGDLVRKVGGKGEGPGEFMGPALVRRVPNDSLLLWDTGLRRLQMFSLDGLGNRTVPLGAWPRGAGNHAPAGAHGSRLLVRTLRPLNPSIYRIHGPSVDSVSFVWLDPGTGDTIHVFSWSFPFYFANPPQFALIPLRIRPSGAIGEAGAFVTGGAVPEIQRHGLDGALIQILRIDTPDRRVTEEDLRAYAASQTEPEYYDELLDSYRAMPIPDDLPWFDELRLDEVGWVWAEIYEPDRSLAKEWVVFDEEGRARGTMLTPPGLDVQWIGEDQILGVWLDELGVEQVRSYGLLRGPSGEEESEASEGN